MTKRTEAQKEAERKNDENRKSSPRLPSSRMTKDQSEIMEQLYIKCGGTKIDAILTAAQFYLKNIK